MGWLSQARVKVANWIAPQRRTFNAAQIGRLTADWFAAATSADAEIRRDIRRLIDRSRDLERNNDYQRGFLLACQRNINGSHKYDLRSDAGEYVSNGKGKEPTWQADKLANRLIETAWAEWGKRGVCTVDRRTNWRGVKRLCVRSVVRDGNFLCRKIRGSAAGNRFGFALQIWEIDHLCLEKFDGGQRGNEVRFGIEYGAHGEPVAYWLRARHPGDMASTMGSAYMEMRPVRFPADEIYHVFIGDRAEQSVGYPWVVSAITRLRQLGAFEEAAVIAARLGASKAAFLTKQDGSGGIGAWTGPTDASGRAIMETQPGQVEELPQGWGVSFSDWQYPNIETGEFRKAMLRGVATGLGQSYTTLGNDLESVNFSSSRVGLFEEREGWKDLQLFFDEDFDEPVFADWLEAAIMNGALNLPLGKFAKFNRPVFKSRRWAAIDPLKEIEAARIGIALRTTSRTRVIEDNGGDREEMFLENKADEDAAESIGLELQGADKIAPANPDQLGEETEETAAKPKKAPPAEG